MKFQIFLMNLLLIVMKFQNITPDNPTIIHIEFSGEIVNQIGFNLFKINLNRRYVQCTYVDTSIE